MKLFTGVCLCSVLLLFFPFYINAQEENISVGGTTRSMIVYTPAGLVKGRPLMISMHGMSQDPNYQKNQSKWEQVADTAKFAVVYPRGISQQWNLSGSSDIDFILAIIDNMYNRYGIDKSRVYLSGFSMGGMMTYYAATKIADKIAAFAPVSGYSMGGPNTNSSRPIPLMHVHGTSDDVVGYSGVQNSINAWVKRNNCPSTPTTIKPYPASKANSIATKSTWGPGTNGVEVVLLTLEGKGHWWSLDVAAGVHTSQEIWNFCRKYSLNLPPGEPSLISSLPENNSFELPLSFDSFFLTFDEAVDCSKAKAVLTRAKDTIPLILSETGLSKSLTFKRSANNILQSGEYSLSVTFSNKTEVLRYSFGESELQAKYDTLITDSWKSENVIPDGWKVSYNSITREQNSTQSAGPRLLKFPAGGDFEYGMYLRDEGSVCQFTYGGYDQKRLKLTPGIYSVSFFYSWWTAGTAERNRKINFSVLDLKGKVVYEKRDIATNHGLNENRSIMVSGSKNHELYFNIQNEQEYIVQWTTEQFGYDGAIVGKVNLISYPTLSDYANKLKSGLALSVLNSQKALAATDSSIYAGSQRTLFLNTYTEISNKKVSSPSEYLTSTENLNNALEVFLKWKMARDKDLGLSTPLVLENKEISNISYFSTNGVKSDKMFKGFNIIRVLYKDGSEKVFKILVK